MNENCVSWKKKRVHAYDKEKQLIVSQDNLQIRAHPAENVESYEPSTQALRSIHLKNSGFLTFEFGYLSEYMH